MTPATDSTRQVRSAALSTGIGALILLYLGFASMEPSRNDLAGWCLWLLYQTLRIGGIVSVGATLLLVSGWRPSLLLDAIISMVIGGALIITAGGWLLFGGFGIQAVVGVIGGMMFVSSGWRNGQIYVGLAQTGVSPSFKNPVPPFTGWTGNCPGQGDVVRSTTEPSPPLRASSKSPNGPQPSNSPKLPMVPKPSNDPKPLNALQRSNGPPVDSAEAPAEGFLAALGRKKRQTDESAGGP